MLKKLRMTNLVSFFSIIIYLMVSVPQVYSQTVFNSPNLIPPLQLIQTANPAPSASQGNIFGGTAFTTPVSPIFPNPNGAINLLNFTNQNLYSQPCPNLPAFGVVQDPTAIDGLALALKYDVTCSKLNALSFTTNSPPSPYVIPVAPNQVSFNVSDIRSVHFRARVNTVIPQITRFVLEYRYQGEVVGKSFISKLIDSYQMIQVPFYVTPTNGDKLIDEVSLVVLSDSDPENMGQIFIDELLLSVNPYSSPATPSLPTPQVPTITPEQLHERLLSRMAHYYYEEVIGSYRLAKKNDLVDYASASSIGYSLAAMALLAKKYDPNDPNWNSVTPAEAEERAYMILKQLLIIQSNQAALPDEYGIHGLFYKYINILAMRHEDAPVSVMDSAIIVAGAAIAGEYFGGDVQAFAKEVYYGMDFQPFLDDQFVFYKEWSPESSHLFPIASPLGGFLSCEKWEHASGGQVTLLSLIAIGRHPQNNDIRNSFFGFDRNDSVYQIPSSLGWSTAEFVSSPTGSLMDHLVAHSFIDFESLGPDDPSNVPFAVYPISVDWWENSRYALKTNMDFSHYLGNFYEFSFLQNRSWGLSHTYRPDAAYEALYGAEPGLYAAGFDGVVNPLMPLSAITLAKSYPTEPIADNFAFQTVYDFYYQYFPSILFGAYGLYPAYDDLGNVAKVFDGSLMGPAMLMGENYHSAFFWDHFRTQPLIENAIQLLFSQQSVSLNLKIIDLTASFSSPVLSFGTATVGSDWVSAEHLVLIDYEMNGMNMEMHLFTDNYNNNPNPYSGAGGVGSAAGLVGMTDTSVAVPMNWVVFDSLQAGAYNFEGLSNEGSMQDKSNIAFYDPGFMAQRIVVDGDGNLAPYPTPNQVVLPGQELYLYLGVDYTNATPQNYYTETITFEIVEI